MVLGGTVGLLLVGLFAVEVSIRWDNERTALRNRDRCDIGQDAFAEPSSVGVVGWQDTTYTYWYHDRQGGWIDSNVFPRFPSSGPADDLPVLRQVPERVRQEAPLTSGAGNSLVWSSPVRESDKGFTTFDVYRSNDGDGYELIVQCSAR